MKFVTFEVITPICPITRIGIIKNHNIIDLNAIYATYLREERGIYRWQELAQSIIPTDMLKFIEGKISKHKNTIENLTFILKSKNFNIFIKLVIKIHLFNFNH